MTKKEFYQETRNLLFNIFMNYIFVENKYKYRKKDIDEDEFLLEADKDDLAFISRFQDILKNACTYLETIRDQESFGDDEND